jgi:hypothetical protein
VAGRIQHRADQRRAHHRLILRQRVFDADDGAHRVIGAEPQAVEQARLGEAPADHLVQPAAHERVLGRPYNALGMGETSSRATTGGQRRRQLLHPVDPCHLLDQIDLTRDIRAAQRGDPDAQTVPVGRGAEVERPQDLLLADQRHRHTEDRLHPRLAQAQLSSRRRLAADIDRAGNHGGSAQLDHQARGDRLGVQALLRLQPLLEASRGLTPQSQRPGGAMDVGTVPGRHLHQHACRVLLDLRARATHHACDRGGTIGILDHDHLAVEGAGLTIERLDLLAGAGSPDEQLPARDAVEVEGVQRLAGEQHRVVGDVDDV